MSGGWRHVPDDPLAELRAQLLAHQARLDELERPTGTQVAETVATVADLEALQIQPAADKNQGTGFTMSTTMTTRATVTFTVPVGFTRALVFGAGFVYSGTAAGGGDRIYGAVEINGSSGPESIALMTTTFLIAGCAAFSAATLTGLTPGGNFTVNMRTRLQFGPGDAAFNGISTATVAASVIYQR